MPRAWPVAPEQRGRRDAAPEIQEPRILAEEVMRWRPRDLQGLLSLAEVPNKKQPPTASPTASKPTPQCQRSRALVSSNSGLECLHTASSFGAAKIAEKSPAIPGLRCLPRRPQVRHPHSWPSLPARWQTTRRKQALRATRPRARASRPYCRPSMPAR